MRRLTILFFIFISFTFSEILHAQQVTAQQLARALAECQDDVKSCMLLNDSLQNALIQTDELWQTRKTYTDSLIFNLKSELTVQDSITGLLKANADTLDLMVKDYGQKLDEVSNLYLKELRQQTKPWFLQSTGLKGFFYGVVIGGAAGLTYSVVK